ncbi:MAG: 2-amino-4-hydroxy-6-hydroxymethyldihydropteridine diphosphokinase [Balneolaceae bacterium]
MEPVIIALGSNLGDRQRVLHSAGLFLKSLSTTQFRKSSIWESEPVGPAKYPFLNAVISIDTQLTPQNLLKKLKQFERATGRDHHPVRWGPRILDLDIIAYGSLVIQSDTLIIPHPEFSKRLFVLLPLQQVEPEWSDPETGKTVSQLVENAPAMKIVQTTTSW